MFLASFIITPTRNLKMSTRKIMHKQNIIYTNAVLFNLQKNPEIVQCTTTYYTRTSKIACWSDKNTNLMWPRIHKVPSSD